MRDYRLESTKQRMTVVGNNVVVVVNVKLTVDVASSGWIYHYLPPGVSQGSTVCMRSLQGLRDVPR